MCVCVCRRRRCRSCCPVMCWRDGVKSDGGIASMLTRTIRFHATLFSFYIFISFFLNFWLQFPIDGCRASSVYSVQLCSISIECSRCTSKRQKIEHKRMSDGHTHTHQTRYTNTRLHTHHTNNFGSILIRKLFRLLCFLIGVYLKCVFLLLFHSFSVSLVRMSSFPFHSVHSSKNAWFLCAWFHVRDITFMPPITSMVKPKLYVSLLYPSLTIHTHTHTHIFVMNDASVALPAKPNI